MIFKNASLFPSRKGTIYTPSLLLDHSPRSSSRLCQAGCTKLAVNPRPVQTVTVSDVSLPTCEASAYLHIPLTSATCVLSPVLLWRKWPWHSHLLLTLASAATLVLPMEVSQWFMDTHPIKVYQEVNSLEYQWGSKYIQASQGQEDHK